MADGTKYGNAVDFDVDLHSIYAAYIFGESLAKDPATTLPLEPVPTRTLSLRRIITLTDLSSYRKLSSTLSSAELSYLRSRVRAGEVGVVEQLFYAGSNGERDTGGVGMRDNGVGYSFASVKSTWWEKAGPPQGFVPGSGRIQGPKGQGQGGKALVLEVGTAVLRCQNLRAVDVWPPVPIENYRKSHLITEEWVDKRANSAVPNFPRAYAFGSSQFVAEQSVEKILDANLGALASHENDTLANTLILLTLGEPAPLPLPASSTLPSNILHLDVLALEHNMLRRAQEQGIPGTPDRRQPLTSLRSLLQTLQIPVPPFAPLGNAGNEAFYTVLAFQKLMMAETRMPELLFQMDYPSYPTYLPSMGSMNFQQQYPVPRDDSRRASVSSQNNYFHPPPPLRVSSTASSPTRGRERGSDEKPRPASMGDTFPRSASVSNNLSHSPRAMTPESHVLLQPGSAPATIRQPSQPKVGRAHTTMEVERERRVSNGASALRPSSTFVSGGERSKSVGNLPPSSLRNQRERDQRDKRSISWKEEKADTASGRRSNSTVPSTESKHSAGEKENQKEKEKQKKLPREKSVKDLAGALARFWTG
ncbi:hypothetical protein P7C73_g1275, partial [Tremellales sp. Uapishka_1]